MSTTTLTIIAVSVLLGVALWKGRKIFISKDDNGDYQLEISKLKKEIKELTVSNKSNFDKASSSMYEVIDLEKYINTKGMTMKKLRAIIKKTK